uniref:CBS domain-containing protein n=1 Tax=Trieres chinensis TaxID=1514140 RepID=A0A7S2A2U5_TRICV|mmetsp:Transcript_38416/g.78373  ORF Transcript_38416/g.78373 Transcript_38416/m.78373 type:complete len:220 (+) Transcript_38416:84-743(+)
MPKRTNRPRASGSAVAAAATASLLFLSPFVSPFSVPEPRSRVFVGTPVKSPQRRVSDCMTPNPFSLRKNDLVDRAIASLLELGVSGAPVVDSEGSLVGVISTSDFLHKELGGAILPMEGTRETVEGYLGAARKIVGRSVGDVMTADVVTVSPDQTMREAAALMGSRKLHRVVVVDEGRLVGILTRSDVMRDVLTTVRGALPQASEEEEGSDEGTSQAMP